MVAKLPFEPFSLLARLAHRGIEKPSANDCSVVRPTAGFPATRLTQHEQRPFPKHTVKWVIW